jgi:hypothetical protein
MAAPNLDPFGFKSNIFVWPQSLLMEKPINSEVLVPYPKGSELKSPRIHPHVKHITSIFLPVKTCSNPTPRTFISKYEGVPLGDVFLCNW